MADKVDGPTLVIDWGEFLGLLFGGGPAGSGGKFRDAYYEAIGKLTPAWSQAAILWGKTGLPGEYWPTQIMVQYGTTFGEIQEKLDDGFNVFEGSNLLGQTMLTSRLHLFVLRKWLEQAIFGTAQFAQMRIGQLQYDLSITDSRVSDLNGRVTGVENSVGALKNDYQQLLNRGLTLQKIAEYILTLQTQTIPSLQDSDRRFDALINADPIGRIASLETSRTEIQATIKDGLWDNITRLWDRVNSLTPGVPADLDERLGNIEATLREHATAIYYDLAPRLTIAEGWITYLRNFNLIYTIPAVTIQAGQITDIYNQIQNNINPRIQQALQRIRQIKQQALPQIRQTMDGIQKQLDDLGNIPNVTDQITQIVNRLTDIETQKTQTILPQLGDLAEAIAELANDLTTKVYPKDAEQDTYITNIQTWITNVAGPTLSIQDVDILNIKTVIKDTILVSIAVFNTFITDIDVYIVKAVQRNCDEIRKCITQGTPPDDSTVCEEGQRFWGRWAECWLDFWTPDLFDETVFSSVSGSHFLNANDPSDNIPELKGKAFTSHLLRIDDLPGYVYVAPTGP